MSSVDDIELRKAFFGEAVDILDRLDTDIAALDGNLTDKNIINAIFRGLHTIKGNSSFLNLEKITRLGHVAETVLDKVRNGEVSISLELVELVRQVSASLRVMIEQQDFSADTSRLTIALEEISSGQKVKATTKPVSAASPEKASLAASEKKVLLAGVVRVDEAKINRILGLVSELELLRYSLEQMPEKMDLLGAPAEDLRFELDLQLSKLSRLTRSLSGIVFGVRLLPVNQVFQRFPRVVQDLAKKLGKEINLQVVRGDAELDKTIVEAIADPMTHLIRNSCDHGIEPSEERKNKGKRPGGTIRLNSYVKGNFVYIEIADDGRGIDGDKVLKKAVEKGIVPAERAASFTEQQKLGLIFAPGFSMAAAVTDISGRGVGMDVVKSNINRLKGTVIIDSKVGRGTVIQLRFPMSMAVLFSLFFDVEQTGCAIPVSEIEESINYRPAELFERIPEGEDPANFHALYSLRSLLWGRPEMSGHKPVYHVLRFREKSGRHMAFIVDDFSSIEEAIVQSVDSYIAALPGLQGATVRKDGSVALVLNPQSIIARALKAPPFAYARIQIKEKSDASTLSDFLGVTGAA
ncbi:MAG: chemotaxis protein CheA [Bacteriovoracia bacterium]